MFTKSEKASLMILKSKDYGRNIPARNKEALEIHENNNDINTSTEISPTKVFSLTNSLHFITKFLIQALFTGQKKAHSQFHSL